MTQIHTGRARGRQRLDRGCHSHGTPVATGSWKRQGKSSLQVWREHTLISDPSLQNCGTMNLCCFKPRGLCSGSPRNCCDLVTGGLQCSKNIWREVCLLFCKAAAWGIFITYEKRKTCAVSLCHCFGCKTSIASSQRTLTSWGTMPFLLY